MKLKNIAGKWFYNEQTYNKLNFEQRLEYEREMQKLSISKSNPAMFYEGLRQTQGNEKTKGYQSQIGKIREVRADLCKSEKSIFEETPPLCRIWQASNRNTPHER